MSVDHLPEVAPAVEDRLPPGRMDGHPLAQIREYRVDPPGYLWNRYFHHGRVFKALIGVPTVFMVGPDANRFILRDHADLFSVGDAWPDYLRFMIGEDALSMKDGDDYHQLRVAVAPAFGAATLRRSLETMVDLADRHLTRWSMSGPVCFLPAVRHLVLDMMRGWILGEPEADEARWLRRQIDVFTRVPSSRRELGSRGAGHDEAGLKLLAREQLFRYVLEVIGRRRDHPQDDVVSLMCDHDDGALTDEQMAAQVMMLLVAGTDSTASTLTWLVCALDRHPEVRRALTAEVDAGDDPTEWSELRRLPYLATVLKEIERMYPVALAPARAVLEDFEFDGYLVPEGWMVRYCIVLTHFLPEVFADPLRFDPDRFAPPREEDKQTPFSLIGFGAGPRHCLGKPLAQLFIQAFVVAMLSDHDFVVLPDQDLTPVLDNNTTFKPRSRLWVQFAPRATGR